MPRYGQLTGSHVGVDGTWLVALDADGTPIDDFDLIPLEERAARSPG